MSQKLFCDPWSIILNCTFFALKKLCLVIVRIINVYDVGVVVYGIYCSHTCLMSWFTRYVNNPYFYLNNNRMSSMLSEGPLRLLLIFSEKANVHRWCLHAYQQDMSWATALRFIMILDLSTTGEYVVLNECRYSYYEVLKTPSQSVSDRFYPAW